ncbi:hypothetical protein [Desulfosudis oleivorans]|uniref:Uncharacterized protein n=1 Tax=Desulfosudis oleivorans (strain DSM 6200 / JCM 39069 / Hxd3) TaxID=96561 RepID=A8ZYV3_DESOH|nr:hypothetical protein [Desulfosudis oleivorans]ABW67208.1 hypothetical protein Dole_1404 [Desulfosudis oleivorans Hxd3]
MNGHAVRQKYKQALIVAIVGMLVLFLAAFLLIRPLAGKIDFARQEIAMIEGQFKEQEILHPAYQELVRQHEDMAAILADIDAGTATPFLIDADITLLPEAFRNALGKTGLTLETCVPDLASITQGESSFLLDIGFTGNFIQLPKWFDMLEMEQRVVDVRRMTIRQDGKKQYGMTLWVNMDR